MYQYIFDEETTKKANENINQSKSIFEKFNDVDNKYSNLSNSNQELKLEKLEYEKPTTEQVKGEAVNSLEGYKNSSINNINQTFDEKNSNIDESIQKAKTSNERDIKTIKNNYETIKQNAKEDAIKRGIARSSIVINTLSNLDNNLLSSLEEKQNELNSKLASYENEKSLLEIEKQKALSNFNIEYAIKLQDKINTINSNIEEKQQEVLEYNNKIAEKEAQWQKEQNDTNYDRTVEMAKLMADQGITIFEVLKQNEKYEMAKTYFSTIPKQQAIDELKNNSDYLKHLGSSFYHKILTEQEKRS